MEKIPTSKSPKQNPSNTEDEKKERGKKVLKALKAFLAGRASEEQKRFLEEVKREALSPEFQDNSTLSDLKKDEKKEGILKKGGTWHDKYDNY